MEHVHVFSSAGRFSSAEDLRRFVDLTYTADGHGVPSPFAREIELRRYEPTCVELYHSGAVVPVRSLLDDASYGDQWLAHLDPDRMADAAVCVFGRNDVRNPRGSSLDYCGAFAYDT